MFDQLTAEEVQEIHESLKPLFAEAKEKNLWFFQPNQQIWFTPDELLAKHAEGKWVWGPSNWLLRAPQEELDRLYKATLAHRQLHDAWQKKMLKNGIYPDPF